MGLSHVVWVKTGVGIPVPEAAASHWFTWALGAIGVEVMFGLVKLPRWSRDLRLAAIFVIGASALGYYLPWVSKETIWHNFGWFLIHPLWGLGFFIIVNRFVLAEQSWLRQAKMPSMVSIFATLGIFSYSIYLTHELVIMQSWRWTNPASLQITNVFMVILPATILFAWIFFWFCEKPFMVWRKPKPIQETSVQETQTSDWRPKWTPIPESQPSAVSG
jgi:peptidoglycan/LPS O-acetylase OafA/YrhL